MAGTSKYNEHMDDSNWPSNGPCSGLKQQSM